MKHISQSDLLLHWQHRNAWLVSFLTFSYSTTQAVVMVSTSTTTPMTSDSTSTPKPLLPYFFACWPTARQKLNHGSNFLQLIYEKADLRLIFPKPLRRTTHNSLSFHNTSLTSTLHLHNQGVILDSRLLLEHHTNHITKKTSFHLKNITSFCPPLFSSRSETLMDTFIWSRPSWCNSIDFDLFKPFSKV